MMARGSRTSHGLSLVEILSVLAIIAIMASVTVPMMWRMGAFSRERRTGAARELYAMLRAAKVYAASNRVDTALAYYYNPEDDNHDPVLGFQRQLLNTTIIVRKLTSGDFVPLQNRNGAFRAMEEGTCAYLTDVDSAGLKEISVRDAEDRPLYVERDGILVPVDTFLAHVFKPSGRMRTDSQRQRFELKVGLTPDANIEERFVDVDPEPPDQLEEILIPVELFSATGRVNVAD